MLIPHKIEFLLGIFTRTYQVLSDFCHQDEFYFHFCFTDDQIKQKWKSLRYSFTKVDWKIINCKEVPTFYEKQLYRQLYFLKPFTQHLDTNASKPSKKRKSKNKVPTETVHKTAYDKKINEKKRIIWIKNWGFNNKNWWININSFKNN